MPDQQIVQQVLALNSERLPQKEIGRRLGIHQSTVSEVLRAHGLGKGKGGAQRLLERHQVLLLWQEHRNQHTIARHLGVHQASVSRVLRAVGVHVGKGGRPPVHQLPMQAIAEQYQSGTPTTDLGRQYGVDPEVIRRRLLKIGVQIRTLARANGPRNPQYKHGKGYNPMHYYRRQSYEVAAICLQQTVPQGWVIHHLDENPHNNQPANLILFPSQRHHARFHQRQSALQREGSAVEAIRLALESGGVQLPQPAAPIVSLGDTDPRAP